MIFVSFSKAVIKQSISTNIVVLVATVADHKTPGDDLQKKTPYRSGSFS